MVDAGGERVRVAADVAWTQDGDRIIALALSQASRQPVSLEGTAAVVWAEIVEGDGMTLTQLVATMADAFDTPAAVVESALHGVIAELQDRGLLAA